MTYRELSTILAALRMFQRAPLEDQWSWAHFDKGPPLTPDQIDHLCEEMNTTGWAALRKVKLTGIA